jgi:methionyl-tRNA formyltransferase
MRVGFAGTPVFAAVVLEALLAAGFRVHVVLTQPDRPHGRGMKTHAGPVKSLAQANRLPLLQPQTLKSEAARAALLATPLDVLVVAAYGLILPPEVLAWPAHGCINVHASVLPRWRGAAPIERALLAGDRATGISIMQMDSGVDTGPVIAALTIPIAPREIAGTLRDKLAAAGARAAVNALAALEREGSLRSTDQERSGATLAPKIQRREAIIDWNEDATTVDRQVRAFDPVPGAQTTLAGETLKIWRAEPAAGPFGAAGTVMRADAAGILVACGSGALVVRELQRPGGRRLPVAAFLAGRPLGPGARFGDADP